MSFPSSLWAPSYERPSSLNFSNMSHSHGLQFVTTCSSMGPFLWSVVLQEQAASMWAPFIFLNMLSLRPYYISDGLGFCHWWVCLGVSCHGLCWTSENLLAASHRTYLGSPYTTKTWPHRTCSRTSPCLFNKSNMVLKNGKCCDTLWVEEHKPKVKCPSYARTEN